MRSLTVATTAALIMISALAASADGTAELQVIHNAADPAAAVVDIYVNDGADPFINDFAFRTATPFVSVPAGVNLNIGVSPGSSAGPGGYLADFDVVLEEGERYVVIANGVLDPSGFDPNPDGASIGFSIYPVDGVKTSTWPWLVRVLGFHGATDAPTVDIIARRHGRASWVAHDLGYGEYTRYRYLLPRHYVLDVTPAGDNSTIVASFEADLSGLGGGTGVVFASGFLNSLQGPAFGLFVALPDGTVVELPAESNTARLQVIHNAADPAAALVDIYVNEGNDPFIDDFAFRAATPFVDVPAGVNLNIGVAPGSSTGPAEIIRDFDVVLEPGKTYVAIANGVLSPGSFDPNPDGMDIAFTLFAKDGVREAGSSSGVSLLAFHGATDAPTVDVRIHGPYHIWTLFNDFSYGEFSSYREVFPLSYKLEVTPGNDNDVVVAAYEADLTGLSGGAAVVFASGFLNDAQGPAFGLFVALPDGSVLELPSVQATARLQVIHNAADPSAEVVDVYVNGGAVPFLDDFEFRTATPYVDVPAGVNLNIGIAPGSSTGPGDIITDFDVTLTPNERYVAIANGVLSPGGFDPNPDGREIGFTLFPRGGMREYVHLGLVKVIVFHGATDAPAVDVIARGRWFDWKIVDNAAYGDFSDYATLLPWEYGLDVTLANDNSAVVASYEVDLGPAGGKGVTVFASGFLNDAQGPAFGLFAALPDGTVLELPLAGAMSRESTGLAGAPAKFELFQNQPNPFNPVTTISFALPEPQDVKVTVYNPKGQVVRTLVDGHREAGLHQIRLEADGLASGVYFYRIDAGPHSDTKKMLLMK
jgi:hypothetical protein